MGILTQLGMVAVAIATYVGLDAIWLGVVARNFYAHAFGSLGKRVGETLTPNWIAVALTYVLLAVGLVVFVRPQVASVRSAALFGAGYGFVVYGVYDLTNLATLAGWPLQLSLVDASWGALASCVASVVLFTFFRSIS